MLLFWGFCVEFKIMGMKGWVNGLKGQMNEWAIKSLGWEGGWFI